MLTNHRRAIVWSAVLLGAMVFVFAAVGRHPEELAPETTLPFVGRWDLTVFRAMDDIRNEPLTLLARFLNVLGSGVVTIPLRIAVSIWLAYRRRWRALVTWVVTWALAELILAGAKTFFHRGRPPLPLVDVVGFSFPSGHAVAGAATAVALVLVLLPAGPARRRWELAAVAFAFVMASSRVYLQAHWFSDVVAGVLLGTGVALGTAGVVTEIRDVALRRKERAAA
ncbi:MAG TPA: phosphatase PAP2 family protein [Actinomycetota bacterium]|nr:phosphatase PAP2 family protein [Actinomycetota bacterium]